MALNSSSYILNLDHVKSSLVILFFLSYLIESIFHQLSGSTFFFSQKLTPKSRKFNVLPNFTWAWFLEGQYKGLVKYLVKFKTDKSQQTILIPVAPPHATTGLLLGVHSVQSSNWLWPPGREVQHSVARKVWHKLYQVSLHQNDR